MRLMQSIIKYFSVSISQFQGYSTYITAYTINAYNIFNCLLLGKSCTLKTSLKGEARWSSLSKTITTITKFIPF